MTATKKSMRFLTAIALSLAMVLSIALVPASATGVENWGMSGYSGQYNIHGYNLTPTKTLQYSGTLYFVQRFNLTDLSTNSNTAVCTLEIRSTNGTVLARQTGTTSTDTLTYGACSLSVTIPVTAGQKIQVYTSVYDSSTGYARRSMCEYDYRMFT